MTIPDFETLLLPLLRLSADGKLRTMAEARDTLAQEFGLTPAELEERLPSGRIPRWHSRVGWASFYLMKAGLIEKPRRGHFAITEQGRVALAENPQRIDVQYLQGIPQFAEFANVVSKDPESPEPDTPIIQDQSPEEAIERSYEVLRRALAGELLTAVKSGTPAFFERLVVELLLKMGYGGSHAEAGRAIGKAGDEGIDGIINEDRLGLDSIYIQAKRWEGTVGRPEIQKFVGALHGKRADKGVFITTGTFTADAESYVSQIGSRVVLIDGAQLATYMIEFNLGVAPRATYEVKRIDSDYLREE